MLGSVADGAVRLFPIGGDGHLGIAEGIETALAAQAMFGVPVWAALSADNLARWRWPVDVRRVAIFADAGEAGRVAAARLAERLSAAGVPNHVMVPLNGDDFNETWCAARRRRLHARLGPGGRPDRAETASAIEPSIATAAFSLAAELEAAAEQLTNPPDAAALGSLLGRLVLARLDPLPERQVLARIKTGTGIPMAVLDKQLAELRRRLNATGDLSHRAIRPAWSHGSGWTSPASPSATRRTSSPR